MEGNGRKLVISYYELYWRSFCYSNCKIYGKDVLRQLKFRLSNVHTLINELTEDDFLNEIVCLDILILTESWCSTTTRIDINEVNSYNSPRMNYYSEANRNRGCIELNIKELLSNNIVKIDSWGIIWFRRSIR